jgi:hypothetical protein
LPPPPGLSPSFIMRVSDRLPRGRRGTKRTCAACAPGLIRSIPVVLSVDAAGTIIIDLAGVSAEKGKKKGEQ